MSGRHVSLLGGAGGIALVDSNSTNSVKMRPSLLDVKRTEGGKLVLVGGQSETKSLRPWEDWGRRHLDPDPRAEDAGAVEAPPIPPQAPE
jgi:hypothetical protein